MENNALKKKIEGSIEQAQMVFGKGVSQVRYGLKSADRKIKRASKKYERDMYD